MAEYKLDLKKVTCECPQFKFRLKRFSVQDSRRLCKHLLPFASQINFGPAAPGPNSRKGKHPREKMEALRDKLQEIFDYFAYDKVEYCGSFRRNAEVSGDMDVLICWKNYEDSWKDIENLFGWLKHVATETLVDGKKKISIVIDGIQTDVRLVPETSWAYALLHSTGTQAENIRLRAIAKRKKMMLNEYGLYSVQRVAEQLAIDGESKLILQKTLISCKDEREIYSALGESYREPWNR